jgi:UDPglucose 6-dehydrogenase
MADREPIGVIGAGWVGLVTAACFADLGHDVHVRDIVAEKIDALNAGRIPIFEPGLEELIERNRERLRFTTEMGDVLASASLLFCCVDTPPTYSGDADLSRVMTVVDEIGNSTDHSLVMKSTVPVGTGRSIARSANGLAYVSNPEFLKEGSAVDDFMKPDRVVVGAGDDSERFADRVAALYEPLDAPMVRTDVASAEMIKLASNAFLATKISFINEIANVSEELGADVGEVARGMGLDARIGPQFLRPGIGYGGSCLVGDETVLVRRQGRVWMWTLAEMFDRLGEEAGVEGYETDVVYPDELEVLSWREGKEAPEFLRVAAATRRDVDGELIEVRTKMGRRVLCTPDHPFVTADADGSNLGVKDAEQLTREDWLPVAQGAPIGDTHQESVLSLTHSYVTAELNAGDVIVRPARSEVELLASRTVAAREAGLERNDSLARIHEIVRSSALRLDEASQLGLALNGASLGTARNGTYVPAELLANEAFWRIVGLYIAEGHCSVDGQRHRLQWSFHPTNEVDLVQEVAGFWEKLGVKATVRRLSTTTAVTVSSRLLGSFWVDGLGLGRNCYEQRVPDLAWQLPEKLKRSLLSGMWRGDGSWSYVAGGPSVVLEYGTASRELADGLLRLLGELGLMARLQVGRTAKSTCDNYWITIAGADQVERALFLVSDESALAIRDSLANQAKRIAPTGYRPRSPNTAWVRVAGTARRRFRGPVYSLEVPSSETFITTGGLVVHNCFPKDVSALKQLAGNTGYHFQLLTSVIEVNELQKRRTVQKLVKHLGSLVGKQVALLGISFKPNTDDIREATSLVLAARLQGEGAHVRAYDPVAGERAREMLGPAEICDSALDALRGADAAVLVTEWPEFRELEWAGEVKHAMKQPLIVDGRNYLDREALVAAGYTYEGVGR